MLKKKILRLPKSRNGIQRGQAGFGCYGYQKEELKKIARSKGMSVSLYVNLLLWKDITTKQLNKEVDEEGLPENILRFKTR